MTLIAVRMKIMPKSPESEMAEIQKQVGEILHGFDVRKPDFVIEPIAFGLKALIMMFGWPEDRELEELEHKLLKIHHVGSVEVLDIRRAIG